MTRRLLLLAALFLGTSAYVLHAMHAEEVPLRQPLGKMSRTIARWTGRDDPPFSAAVLAALGADEHISRTYQSPGEPSVSLFVGYYKSQREGDTMHSPLNCMPGAGWEPIVTERLDVPLPGRAPIRVNAFVIRKGIDRQVVVYWYQSHGRVVASEYWSKLYLVYDAARFNRSDAAMVRVISPVMPAEDGPEAATRRVTEFVQGLFPNLGQFLPS